MLFIENSYLKDFETKIKKIENNNIILEQTAFYAKSGGQPGDMGKIIFNENEIDSDECQNNIKARKSNCIDALSLLGIKDPTFIDYPCGRLDTIPIIEINKKIEKAISIYNPDITYYMA